MAASRERVLVLVRLFRARRVTMCDSMVRVMITRAVLLLRVILKVIRMLAATAGIALTRIIRRATADTS